MEAVPARPTMGWSAASQADRPLDASPAHQRPGDLAGLAGPQKGNSVWTTPNGCAVWPSTTRTLRKKALEEPGPGRELDPKTLELVRLAALVAVGGAVPSYGAHADEA